MADTFTYYNGIGETGQVGQDWAVSPYLLDGNYQVMNHTISAKSQWNKVLVDNPVHAEFNVLDRELTARERAVAVFLKQSEFKRPNQAPSYQEMEYILDPPPGFDIPDWYFPGLPDSPVYDTVRPVTTVFNFSAFPGYCPGETVQITWFATQPVYSMYITSGSATLSDITGLGTPSGTANISTPDSSEGFVTIEAVMMSSDGIWGDSNENLLPYSDCEEDAVVECPDECSGDWFAADGDASANTVANGATVNVAVSGGQPPYSWEVEVAFGDAGSGFTLGASVTNGTTNTLTNTTQCGTATITVTDNCGCVVQIEVRSTYSTSSWVTGSSGAGATCPAWADGVSENTSDAWFYNGNHMIGVYLRRDDPSVELIGRRLYEQLSEINIAFGTKAGAPAPCPTAGFALNCIGGSTWERTECIYWPDEWGDSPREFCDAGTSVFKTINNQWTTKERYCAQMEEPECDVGPQRSNYWDYFVRCARVTIRRRQQWKC